MLLFILYCLLCRRPVADFNTSHVTVYHDPSFYYRIYEAFQYISCYCLSVHSPPRLVGILISIHLMLLFIEQVLLKSSMICHFNTSHVTVYHRQENDRSSSFRISIHLMLLFILLVFLRLLSRKQISIHLMLLFIFLQLCLCYHLLTFQYISCYCLSKKFEHLTPHLAYFNTSHVTVYRLW